MAKDALFRYKILRCLERRLARVETPDELWAAVFEALFRFSPDLTGLIVHSPHDPDRILRFGSPEEAVPVEIASWRVLLGHGTGVRGFFRFLRPTLRAALERFELLALLEDERRDVALLSRISHELAGASREADLFSRAFEALHTRYPALSGCAARVFPGGRLHLFTGFGSLHPSARVDPNDESQGVSGGLLAYRQRRPVYARVEEGAGGLHFEDGFQTRVGGMRRRILRGLRARAAAFFPVPVWGAVYGIVGLFHPDAEFFEPQVRQVVEGVVTALSRAMERALDLEEERKLADGIRILSEITVGTDWQGFLQWGREALGADGSWLLWEDRNLGPDFWTTLAVLGPSPGLPAIFPADEVEELVRAALAKQELIGDFVPLERGGVIHGAWGWSRPVGSPPLPVPAWISVLTEHLAMAIEDWRHHVSLQSAAYHDPLTGLYNRAFLEEYLDEERNTNRPFAFVIFDLDRFKELNDNHGHDYGDEVLRLFGARLWESLREGDLAIRLGGDEFVAILPGCPEERCLPVLRRIIRSLPLRDYDLGVSAGVAFSPRQGRHYQELYRLADQALYRAKKAGRNAIAFSGRRDISPIEEEA